MIAFTGAAKRSVILLPVTSQPETDAGTLSFPSRKNWSLSLLIASLIYYEGISPGRNVFSCLLPLTLGFIWCIFPTIVLSLILLSAWLYFGGLGKLLKLDLMHFLTKLCIPVLVCLPVLVYFLSSSGIPIRGFLWTFSPQKPIVIDYIICVLLDVVILFLIWKYGINNKKEVPNRFFYGLLAFVPIFGVYRFGFANDWLVRGTMPLFIILFLAILRAEIPLKNKTAGVTKTKILMISFILLCLVAPLSYLYRGFKNNVFLHGQSFKPYSYDKYPNVYQAIKDHHGQPEAAQYLGNKQSAYWKYLSGKGIAAPVSE